MSKTKQHLKQQTKMTTPDNTNPEAAVPVDSSTKAITNPATQTLFRFVSLRNPQLAETSEKNLGFIIRPDHIQGYFDTAIQSWTGNPTKIQILEQVAVDFVAFKKENEVEALSSDYYQLGKSLSKNEEADLTKIYSAITNANLIKLWDNLIYQVVTQKDFYIKEAIIQTLKAVHYLKTHRVTPADKLEENTTQAKNAKVVLPAKLFVEDAPVENEVQNFTVDKTIIGSKDAITAGGTAARILEPSHTRSLSVMQESRLKVNAEKNLKVTTALLKKEMLQTLKKELEKLQKSYSKAYYKAYNSELAAYQAEIQPIIESSNKILDDLEATFGATTTEAAKKQAYENLELTDVPRFEFTYKKEINFSDLKAKLSLESFNLFIELFADYDADTISSNIEAGMLQNLQIISDTEIKIYGETVTLSDDYVSYQNIFEKVNEEVSIKSKVVLSTVEMPKQQFVNLGGALVPVAKTRTIATLSYFLQASYIPVLLNVRYHYLQFGFTVENESWSVATAKIKAETNRGTVEQTHNNLTVIDQKITFPVSLFNTFSSILSLRIEIYFDNGREAVLELSNIVSNVEYPGVLKLKTLTGNTSGGGMTPKHFGVKRLGIADYLKVEQSIHAYVPGEVSNIENVMASELRHKSISETTRTEDTLTTSKSQEVEKVSDTTKVDRTDVQTEVAKELDKQQSWEAHTNFSYNKGYKLEIGGSYANSTAQHDSTRQAVAKSQEITERAMERVVSKISEERIQKIIHEVTLQNVHEFDNRGKAASVVPGSPLPAPPQHITGVYRWVDKKMKNQIYNYGKRTMFEFMIPEPARLHRLAIGASSANILTAPNDPRNPSPEVAQWKMTKDNVSEENLQYWAEQYDVKLTVLPKRNITVPQPQIYEKPDDDGTTKTYTRAMSITENYSAITASVNYTLVRNSRFYNSEVWFNNFNKKQYYLGFGGKDIKGTIPLNDFSIGDGYIFDFHGRNIESFDFTIIFDCTLSDEYMNTWKQSNFKTIIDAYNLAKATFDKAQADADAQAAADAADNKEKVSLYYRDMEAEVLKHNCIAYLLQDYGALGAKDLYGDDEKTMQSFYVKFGDNLDAYTSLAKFMEQAMEWTIMDYTFYPYYWADSNHWKDMYLSSDLDPLFRNFLQAGMARVIVTVKPGFEDAVNFYMTTGRIWNGGEVPVIGDPMYMSIVEELRQPTGKKQGNYWITRVPTALTILQAGSVGLVVDDSLPIFKEEHPEECENPLELETKSSFGKPINAVMQNVPGMGSTIPTEINNYLVNN